MKFSKGIIVIGENHLLDNSTLVSNLSEKESHLEVGSIMMVDVTTEAVMVEIKRKIDLLKKAIKERDYEIIALRDQ